MQSIRCVLLLQWYRGLSVCLFRVWNQGLRNHLLDGNLYRAEEGAFFSWGERSGVLPDATITVATFVSCNCTFHEVLTAHLLYS